MFNRSQNGTIEVHCQPFSSNPVQYFTLSNLSHVDSSTSFRVVRLLSTLEGSIPLYEKKVKGKGGRGLFTIRPISKGDLIVIEKPYLVLPLTEEGEGPDSKVYHKVYRNLSPKHQTIFDDLYERKDDQADKDHIVNKIDTNAIPFDQTSQDGSIVKKMGLFEVISRVNHSCKPNAGWYWYKEEEEMSLHAYTDIPAHTEITCSYLVCEELLEPSSARRSILLDKFGFGCDCKGCNQSSLDILSSDNRLMEYRSLRSEWSNKDTVAYCKIDDDFSKTLKKLNRSLELLKSEERFDLLGEIYGKIFEVHAVYGHLDLSKLAGKEALDHYKAIMGEKEAMETWVAHQSVDPTLYPLWNKLGTMEHDDELQGRKRGRRRGYGKRR